MNVLDYKEISKVSFGESIKALYKMTGRTKVTGSK